MVVAAVAARLPAAPFPHYSKTSNEGAGFAFVKHDDLDLVSRATGVDPGIRSGRRGLSGELASASKFSKVANRRTRGDDAERRLIDLLHPTISIHNRSLASTFPFIPVIL